MTYTPFNPWQNAPFGPDTPTGLNALRMQQHALIQQQKIQLQQKENTLQATYMAQEFGRLIALRRTSLGLSHEQLAALSGVGTYEIIQIESGITSATFMEKCFTIMAALRLNLSVYPV